MSWKTTVKPFVPDRALAARRYAKWLVKKAGERSYAQEGEDLILSRIFGTERRGFYVDVGAFHPRLYSNTYLFYRRGWHGINIDAMPGGMKAFVLLRPRDINLELAISDREDSHLYYEFGNPAYNGFSEEISLSRHTGSGIAIVNATRIVPMYRLDAVLDRHLPPGQNIDFLSVDVEGWDLRVLASNDWIRYRPKIVLAEILNADLSDACAAPETDFMRSIGYVPYAKSVNTVFFGEPSFLAGVQEAASGLRRTPAEPTARVPGLAAQ